MKRQLLTFITCLMMIFSLNSCTATYAFAQDYSYTDSEVIITPSNFSFDVVINNGAPYYSNGRILYYIYNDVYYYPFYYSNRWYVRAYRRPFVNKPYFRPRRNDYYFRPGYYAGFNKPNYYRSRNPYIKDRPRTSSHYNRFTHYHNNLHRNRR